MISVDELSDVSDVETRKLSHTFEREITLTKLLVSSLFWLVLCHTRTRVRDYVSA